MADPGLSRGCGRRATGRLDHRGSSPAGRQKLPQAELQQPGGGRGDPAAA